MPEPTTDPTEDPTEFRINVVGAGSVGKTTGAIFINTTQMLKELKSQITTSLLQESGVDSIDKLSPEQLGEIGFCDHKLSEIRAYDFIQRACDFIQYAGDLDVDGLLSMILGQKKNKQHFIEACEKNCTEGYKDFVKMQLGKFMDTIGLQYQKLIDTYTEMVNTRKEIHESGTLDAEGQRIQNAVDFLASKATNDGYRTMTLGEFFKGMGEIFKESKTKTEPVYKTYLFDNNEAKLEFLRKTGITLQDLVMMQTMSVGPEYIDIALDVGGIQTKVQVLPYAGQGRFFFAKIIKGEGCIAVADETKPETLNDIGSFNTSESWLGRVYDGMRIKTPDTPIPYTIIVSNKHDLTDDNPDNPRVKSNNPAHAAPALAFGTVERYAKNKMIKATFQASAKTGQNWLAAYTLVAANVLRDRLEKMENPSGILPAGFATVGDWYNNVIETQIKPVLSGRYNLNLTG